LSAMVNLLPFEAILVKDCIVAGRARGDGSSDRRVVVR
jgi:hypothetical protein